jgi:hypothetical protein
MTMIVFFTSSAYGSGEIIDLTNELLQQYKQTINAI